MRTFRYVRAMSRKKAGNPAAPFITGGTSLPDGMKLDIERPATPGEA